MDEGLLRVFQAVVKFRNFSRAADVLHMAQPTVSQQIHRLETLLQARLFNRTSKSVTLTPAGRALNAHVGVLLEQFAEVRRSVIEAEGRITGPLTIGASMTIGQYVLPKPIADFIRNYPNVKVQVSIDNTEQIVQQVVMGAVDIGLVEGPVPNPDIIEETFLEDEVVFIAPAHHPWNAKTTLSVADLKNVPLIMREEGSGTRRILEERLQAASVPLESLQVITEMAGTEPIKGAVEAGMGVAAVSAWAIQKELRLGTLITRTLDGMSMKRTFRVIFRRGRTVIPAAQAFREQLQSLAGRVPGDRS